MTESDQQTSHVSPGTDKTMGRRKFIQLSIGGLGLGVAGLTAHKTGLLDDVFEKEQPIPFKEDQRWLYLGTVGKTVEAPIDPSNVPPDADQAAEIFWKHPQEKDAKVGVEPMPEYVSGGLYDNVVVAKLDTSFEIPVGCKNLFLPQGALCRVEKDAMVLQKQDQGVVLSIPGESRSGQFSRKLNLNFASDTPMPNIYFYNSANQETRQERKSQYRIIGGMKGGVLDKRLTGQLPGDGRDINVSDLFLNAYRDVQDLSEQLPSSSTNSLSIYQDRPEEIERMFRRLGDPKAQMAALDGNSLKAMAASVQGGQTH